VSALRTLGLGALALAAIASTARAQQDHATSPGQVEGRPLAGELSPLQARLDAAPPGATIAVALPLAARWIVVTLPYVSVIVVSRPAAL